MVYLCQCVAATGLRRAAPWHRSILSSPLSCVTISVDALPDAKLKGAVNFISAVPEVQGGIVRYEARIALDVPGNLTIKSGMRSTATLTAITGTPERRVP